jgi:uncharacterized surface protein with fasciclin (FAS1) repeats
MLRRNMWCIVGVPLFALAVAGLTTTSLAQDKPKGGDKPAAQPGGEKDIIEVAMADKDLSTFAELAKDADLTSTLKGPGPFTVFAPTNAAFDKLGKTKLDELKKDKAKLQSVLKYHVANGSHMAADIKKMKMIKTLNGAELTVTEKDGKWMVEGATLTKTDIKAKNGVIHTVDTVAMPKEGKPG